MTARQCAARAAANTDAVTRAQFEQEEQEWSFPESLQAETFSVSVDANYERYFLGVDATSAGAAGREEREEHATALMS
jgi:hypothetical protein